MQIIPGADVMREKVKEIPKMHKLKKALLKLSRLKHHLPHENDEAFVNQKELSLRRACSQKEKSRLSRKR